MSEAVPVPITIQSPYLTTVEAANYLKLSPSTLNVWRTKKNHPLKFLLVATRPRYTRADLDAFVAGCHVRRVGNPNAGRPPGSKNKRRRAEGRKRAA
ncbi:MAG: helix-turn-helix domain-containing protein [Candidatus Acidiferrales bacterium]